MLMNKRDKSIVIFTLILLFEIVCATFAFVVISFSCYSYKMYIVPLWIELDLQLILSIGGRDLDWITSVKRLTWTSVSSCAAVWCIFRGWILSHLCFIFTIFRLRVKRRVWTEGYPETFARAWFSSRLQGTAFSNRCVSSPFRPAFPVCSFRG